MKTYGGLQARRSERLDDGVVALLRGPNFCTVSTLRPSGGIRSRVVWVDTDGTHVLLNSVRNRSWVRDLERDPRITCSVTNVANPYEFATVEGAVTSSTMVGAEDHIDFLARKYLDVELYPFHDATEPRVLFQVRPERVLHMAPADPQLG